jgi:outer membrane protein assembly factor BamE
MVQTPPLTPPRILRGFAALTLCVLAVMSTGCVYRVAVQQGNFLDPKQVAQLQNGMTRSQVRFLLGTPMLPDAFDADRWDYVYYLKLGRRGDTIQQRLTVYFEDDRVTRFDNVGIEPPKPEAEAASAAPQAAVSEAQDRAPGAPADGGSPSDRS